MSERSAGRALLGLFALVGVAASPARAHAPPQVLEVLEAPGKIVLVTNRGLLIGTRFEPEPDFKMMCSLGLSIGTAERPELALLDDGTMIAATSVGLQRSRDGCSWEFLSPFEEINASALAQDPSARATLYLAVFLGTEGALFVSHDGAASFEKLIDTADFVHQLLPAPSQSQRIYSVRQQLTGAGYEVSVSQDAAVTWETRSAPLLSTEGALELLAVSPVDPDFVLAKGVDDDPVALLLDRLLVSRDGGRTFESPVSIKLLFDASFSADGSTIWAAGIEGLWRSDDGAASFSALPGPARMSCVQERDDALLGCGFFAGLSALQDGIGVSSDRGASFRPLLEFTSIVEPVACAEDSPTARACELLWHDWQREILGIWDAGVPPIGDTDAGPASDGGTEDAGRRSRGGDGGCDCRTVRNPGSTSLTVVLALASLVARARAQRRRPRKQRCASASRTNEPSQNGPP
jgi:hypothetical protein